MRIVEEHYSIQATPNDGESSTQFYYNLLDYLNPAYNISTIHIFDLRNAAYIYFESLIILDGVLDKSYSTFKVLEAISGIEKSIRLLSNLFSHDHPFWVDFERCKLHYYEAVQKEKVISTSKSLFNELDFEGIATGKSSVCYALVHALSHLSKEQDGKRDKDIIQCLGHLHLAFQCKDDIDDFIDDLNNGQSTYAHILALEKHKSETGRDFNGSYDLLHRYFYVSGQANYLLRKSLEQFSKAQKIAQVYNLYELECFIKEEISLTKAQINEIQLLIEKTKAKVCLSGQNNKGATLTESVFSGLKFLETNLTDGRFLSDFMTSAGVGKHWISNYCAFVLSKYEQSKGLIEKLGESLCSGNLKGGGFNERIVQDADSLAFQIGATKRIFDIVDNDFLKLLEGFQNDKGGWSTYIDENTLREQINLDDNISLEGWTAAHNCVSASTCYILSLLPEQKVRFYKTVEFLIEQVDDKGCLSSYWWSSPIYATAWFINALCQDRILKSECSLSVNWLSAQQNDGGGWIDDFSKEDSYFYTAMAVEALRAFDQEKFEPQITKGIKFLLNNQTTDGSWKSGRILTIPQTNIKNKCEIQKWRRSSFGVNILVDDHKRIFTTATVLKTLLSYANQK